MPMHMPSSRRCLSGLVGAAIASASLLAAVPAHADTTTGGSISRDEVIQRAQSWVSEGVPYNQGAYYSDSNGSYREDCSGYVSMAWDLSSSMVTQTLPSVSTQIASSDLQPGDALDYTAEHVILFGGWVDQSAGTFTYYAENNPSELTNTYTGSLDASSLDGWPTSDYTPLRYNNITGTASTTTTPATSTTATTTTGSTTASTGTTGTTTSSQDTGTATQPSTGSDSSGSGSSTGSGDSGSQTGYNGSGRWAWTSAYSHSSYSGYGYHRYAYHSWK
ncbi:C40 family peptidase [Streptacidiphilus sp. PB12-B1b]|uniref:C40 family peptidase n=1 Tax=Streptacidiphilus sp. PB12-B1b TaxID=2705012 RepID=UPI0015F801C3|nr:C40 family peptidase [Streptacidiphilus sp. PB12-B1b]QMU76642.1 C40 family peptidase [Streptacidiphilus sp. PB12-B1b]